MAINQLLKRLATIYAGETIRYPNLRAVSFAQWMLESGRATSPLATDHYNFAGLKWRPEMGLFATRVNYAAHDGTDAYCKFATLENFIRGYWAFIDRAPYSGWESHVDTPEQYIHYIGPIYTPSAGYADKVLALVPEAQSILFEAVTSDGTVANSGTTKLGTLVLDPGHGGTVKIGGSSPNNATSISGVKEKKLALEFCLLLRDELIRQAGVANEEIKVVLTRETDVNIGIKDRAAVAAKHQAQAFICMHFNGDKKPSVSGVETYYRAAVNGNANLADDKAFGRIVQDALFKGLKAVNPGTKNRGLKPDTDTGPGSLGVLSDAALGNSTRTAKCVAAYVELEFITNPAVEKTLISGPSAVSNRKSVMAELAKAVRGHMRKLA
ncbi:N-acetylmuramoyl-L-alanine amidase [Alteraurantiacibacter aestuarii]